MRLSRTLKASSAVAAIALLAAACGGSNASDPDDAPAPAKKVSFADGTTMAAIAKVHKLRVGVKFDHPQLSQKNLKGELEGFEADMIRYIGAKLGLKPTQIEFVEASGTNREEFLKQDKVDMVVATFSITDQRKQVVSFAGPYLSIKQDLVVTKGNPEGIQSPQAPAGKKICSTLGGTVSKVTRQTYPKAKLVEFDVSSKCIEALKNGSVDALATQDLIGASYVSENPDALELLGASYGAETWGIGIKKGNVAFCEFINGALTDFSKDGSYKKAWDATLGRFAKVEQNLPPAAPCA
ncbi:glutamate ABC transporter substrate-binding protein [Streptomyces sp. NPDC020681]|uniref:glutamate ABC transporter substrate-binding protein n=1 Tax=Streptomyces sp. NPDC020681 TaxID=3365083 RepID=UPI0037AE5039